MKPFEHQKVAILRIEECDGSCLLADDMGLGKTITALGCLRRNPDWTPAVIVCPSAVKINWQREANKMGMTTAICNGRTPPSEKGVIDGAAKILIINYDVLPHWRTYLESLKLKMMILDESQYLANKQSKRTQAARKLSRKIGRTLAMSGTPIVNRPVELYSTVNIIWPKEFNNFQIYANRFCAPKMGFQGMDYSGASNLPELHAKLTRLGMIRRRKGVIVGLPDLKRQILRAPLSDPQQYEEARDNFAIWIRKKHPKKANSSLKAAGMAQVGYLLRLAARLKIDAVCKKMHGWLKENPDEKLVVMCIHRDIGESLVKNISVKSIQIHGGVTGKDRQLAVDVFQRDPETRLAVCNIKAAGIGVDGLQKAARRLSFVELWWNPSTHFQCEGRLERIGQEREILIDYIVGKGTIEERLCRILQSRQKVASAAIDGDKEVATFNIYEELLNEMKKESK